MPKSCCAVGCTNRKEKEKKNVPFYNIPKGKTPIEKRRRDDWIQAIEREDWKAWSHEKILKACICGEHFISGTDLELMYSEVIKFFVDISCILCFKFNAGSF